MLVVTFKFSKVVTFVRALHSCGCMHNVTEVAISLSVCVDVVYSQLSVVVCIVHAMQAESALSGTGLD